jgi:alpha-beta hydrolase superfamily lysophospholipase
MGEIATATASRTGTGHYAGATGEIHYRWWSPENPRWVVLLAHGFGDHSGRWSRYGQRLAAAGGAVIACDHSGHGLSEGGRAVVRSFDGAADDYLKLLDVPELPAGLPVVMAGHSMGGLIVVSAVVRGGFPIAAVVVSGARIGGWETAEAILGRIESGEVDPAEGSGHPLLDPNAPLELDALSRDPEVAEMFVADDLAYKGPYPVETLRAFVVATTRLEQLERVISVPTLYMHGGADPITPYRPSVDRLMQLAAGDVEVRIFEGARHSIYNEINRDEVYDVLLRFIDRVVA